jgi:predicted component of type VI protein secretion system
MWYRRTVRRIPIGLSESQHERLGREAARRHVSVAALVREAVDAVFPDELAARRGAREASRTVLGAFDSGRSDISERHDEVLGETSW